MRSNPSTTIWSNLTRITLHNFVRPAWRYSNAKFLSNSLVQRLLIPHWDSSQLQLRTPSSANSYQSISTKSYSNWHYLSCSWHRKKGNSGQRIRSNTSECKSIYRIPGMSRELIRIWSNQSAASKSPAKIRSLKIWLSICRWLQIYSKSRKISQDLTSDTKKLSCMRLDYSIYTSHQTRVLLRQQFNSFKIAASLSSKVVKDQCALVLHGFMANLHNLNLMSSHWSKF